MDVSDIETFEKYSILFKFKPSARRACAPEGKTKILTTPVRSAGPTGQAGIHRVFRGLKFESDQEIGQKGKFCKGLIVLIVTVTARYRFSSIMSTNSA